MKIDDLHEFMVLVTLGIALEIKKKLPKSGNSFFNKPIENGGIITSLLQPILSFPYFFFST